MPSPARALVAALTITAAALLPPVIVWRAAQGVGQASPGPTATSGVGGEPRDGVGSVDRPQPARPPRTDRTQPTRTQAPATAVPATSSTTAAGGSPSGEPPPATSTKPGPGVTVTVTVPPLITQPPATEKTPEPQESGG